VGGEHGAKLPVELDQAGGKRGFRIGADLAVGDVAQPVSLRADDAPAGAAKPRIQAEDDQETRSITSSETS
jgi:hypothetical protein